MTMIEKVARAICWKNGMNPDISLGGDGVNFLWLEYEDQAKAAIEAMADPTYDMLVVGNCAGSGIGNIYEAMIKAALND